MERNVDGKADGSENLAQLCEYLYETSRDKLPRNPKFEVTVLQTCIYDIFVIWQHSEMEPLTFTEAFNLAHSSISLSHFYSTHSMSFLDVKVAVSQGRLRLISIGNLQTRPSICTSTEAMSGTARPQYLIANFSVLGESAQAQLVSIVIAKNLKPHS